MAGSGVIENGVIAISMGVGVMTVAVVNGMNVAAAGHTDAVVRNTDAAVRDKCAAVAGGMSTVASTVVADMVASTAVAVAVIAITAAVMVTIVADTAAMLDEQGSALSRLSAVISGAKDAIDANLTLDSEGSALSRLKRELVTILENHEKKVESSVGLFVFSKKSIA